MIQEQICKCCGSTEFKSQSVLWDDLIREWRLSPHEVDYINRQQGYFCTACKVNLRTIALASAIMDHFSFSGLFNEFIHLPFVQNLNVLELNPAGNLTTFLSQLPKHQLVQYPDVDMMDMPYQDKSFDLVIHSDVLEHIKHPIVGLKECHRILDSNGCCVFTVPIVVDRLTVSRQGLSSSYHGIQKHDKNDYLVHTEYGSDLWTHVALAGFKNCKIHVYEYPAAQAIVAER